MRKRFVTDLWMGKKELATTFWIYFLIPSVLLTLVVATGMVQKTNVLLVIASVIFYLYISVALINSTSYRIYKGYWLFRMIVRVQAILMLLTLMSLHNIIMGITLIYVVISWKNIHFFKHPEGRLILTY
jgi:membrane-associated HD superfamily phosphohydrolase